MAHLGVRDSEQWLVAPLDSEAFTLGANPLQPVQVQHSKNNNNGLATILRRQEANGETWALLTPRNTAVHINGMPVATGIRVLRDRDEIRMNGTDRLFFSTECPAHIEPFPGTGQAIFCPRCKQEIAKEYPAVRCPQCTTWHHQSEDLPCWTYSERCTLCDQPTALDTGYRWTPEDL